MIAKGEHAAHAALYNAACKPWRERPDLTRRHLRFVAIGVALYGAAVLFVAAIVVLVR